ncbi:MAG: YgfZ/GcvT domain-containing protein [Verrucomicrobiales bacterium]
MVADLSSRAKFRLSGADRVRYLNGQVTNNVARLKMGEACYALVCNHKGKVEADVVVHARDGDFLIDADGSLRESLLARLSKYIIADDCEVIDVTEEWALFHEMGTAVGVGSQRPECCCDVVAEINRFGVSGRDCWLPTEEAGPDAVLASEALDLIRLEYGVPVWGAELTPDVLPQEARLEDRAIDFNKGCYIGQEIISRIKSAGKVNRELRALETVEGADWLCAGHRLFSGPEFIEAGVVTSARFHPHWQKSIALGYVKRTLADAGGVFRAGPGKNRLCGTVKFRHTPAA